MTLVIGVHEVEDVSKWLDSPLRKQLFDAKGIKHTTFKHPSDRKRRNANDISNWGA